MRCNGAPPEAVLAAFERHRVLCAVREGEQGTARLNALLTERFRAAPHLGGGTRPLAQSRLPEHETAFAMTVHKAQGSEFERVEVVLPARDSRVLTRELLYTALTRPRASVRLRARAAVLRDTIARRSPKAPLGLWEE